MKPIEAYKAFWKNTFNIKGRATRSEFWHPFWINIVIGIITTIIDHFIGGQLVNSLFSLVLVIPMFTIGVRRLHDINEPMTLQVIHTIIGIIAVVISLIFLGIITGLEASNASDDAFGVSALVFLGILFIIAIISLVIFILLVIKWAKPGDEYENKYGMARVVTGNKSY